MAKTWELIYPTSQDFPGVGEKVPSGSGSMAE